MDPKALFKITYGLYLITGKEGGTDNGCIINTLTQVANDPIRVAVSLQKSNLTHDMILRSKKFTVSALSTDADFPLFQRFGMQSGRNGDKFADFPHVTRCENSLLRLTKFSNMYLSAKVLQVIDLGTHSLFVGEVLAAESLSNAPTCTYDFYQEKIKPQPVAVGKKKWVCNVCGWVYDEEKTGIPWEELPDSFVCPLCKHGKADFSPV